MNTILAFRSLDKNEQQLEQSIMRMTGWEILYSSNKTLLTIVQKCEMCQ